MTTELKELVTRSYEFYKAKQEQELSDKQEETQARIKRIHQRFRDLLTEECLALVNIITTGEPWFGDFVTVYLRTKQLLFYKELEFNYSDTGCLYCSKIGWSITKDSKESLLYLINQKLQLI